MKGLNVLKMLTGACTLAGAAALGFLAGKYVYEDSCEGCPYDDDEDCRCCDYDDGDPCEDCPCIGECRGCSMDLDAACRKDPDPEGPDAFDTDVDASYGDLTEEEE